MFVLFHFECLFTAFRALFTSNDFVYCKSGQCPEMCFCLGHCCCCWCYTSNYTSGITLVLVTLALLTSVSLFLAL